MMARTLTQPDDGLCRACANLLVCLATEREILFALQVYTHTHMHININDIYLHTSSAKLTRKKKINKYHKIMSKKFT